MNKIHLAYTLIVLAVAVMVQQYLSFGVLWSWDQVLHHETLAILLGSFAVGMLAVTKWRHKI